MNNIAKLYVVTMVVFMALFMGYAFDTRAFLNSISPDVNLPQIVQSYNLDNPLIALS
ncbi:MAG: hypothetical protein AB7V50_04755 [Vampirovibrionia bacterium]